MGVNLLIIEMDNFLQDHLSRHLSGEEYRIFTARQKTEAKRMVKRRNIDVVLLSLNDFQNESMVLIKMIKKVRPAVQVITINSGEHISLSIEGMKLGVFDDLLMPLDLDALISRIKAAFQAKKAAEVVKPSLLQRCQDIMVAASFAEAGEAEMAKELLTKRRKPNENISDSRNNEKNERRKK
jgi:DNA-binding NtrC family response regulator